MQLTSTDISGLERRYRAALINAITGFKPANLVGTADAAGNSNCAIMSSLVHIGSSPPLLALIVRPDTVFRHTLDNILATGVYTINHLHEDCVERGHQTAARYPRDTSEFAAAGLGEHWEPGFPAPYVAEAEIRLGMQLREHQPLAINGTHLVIGEIMHLALPDHCVGTDGSLDLAAAGTVALSGLDGYYRGTLLKRMGYAKPDAPPRVLDGSANDS
jgi:flavin reductase (DIM6/NTAB) family NADH-FMN oxidoreductase RutF